MIAAKQIHLVTIRKKAIAPYTFGSGGPHVPIGNQVCAPLQCIMQDEANQANAQVFDGFRFARHDVKCDSETATEKDSDPQERKFTTVSAKFPFWGYGPRAW